MVSHWFYVEEIHKNIYFYILLSAACLNIAICIRLFQTWKEIQEQIMAKNYMELKDCRTVADILWIVEQWLIYY